MNAVTFKEVTVPLANSEAFSNCALPPAEDLMFEMTPAVTTQIAFNWNKKKRHAMIHVLSLVVATHRKFIPSKDTPKCRTFATQPLGCHEPSHLYICRESSQQNQSRKNCIGNVWSDKYQDWVPSLQPFPPPCLTTRKGNQRYLVARASGCF